MTDTIKRTRRPALVIEEIGPGDGRPEIAALLVGLQVDARQFLRSNPTFTGDTEPTGRFFYLTPSSNNKIPSITPGWNPNRAYYFLNARIGFKRTKADIEYDKYDQS